MATNYTIGKKNEAAWNCKVEIQNDENDITAIICYGQGENGDGDDPEYFSGIEIDGDYYEIRDAHNKINNLFPNTCKEIINKLNEIAEDIGLECIE